MLLQPKTSPHAAASLVSLARKRFFDNTIFHRIVPGFVIQGGDPTQSGGGGPGYTTVDTPGAGTRYRQGVVAMAKTQTEPRGAAGSQFFVMTADAPTLPADTELTSRTERVNSVPHRSARPPSTRATHAAWWMPPPPAAMTMMGGFSYRLSAAATSCDGDDTGASAPAATAN